MSAVENNNASQSAKLVVELEPAELRTVPEGKFQEVYFPLPPKPRVYSAPRRFGIGTILGVATACALIVSFLQFAELPPWGIAMVGTFLVLVGGIQAIFQKVPRWASVLTGIACFWIAQLVMTEGIDRFNPIPSITLGGILGYFGGTVVAGIFLVIDGIANFFKPKS